ncbi:hypothetical protein IAT38_007005 [Cryptococcus sp. DSM 104549]
MDLSGLGSTLPPDLADAEREMGAKFRAAALSITTLYKSSLSYTQQGYNAGYSAALKDMLSMVQSSIGEGQDSAQTLSRLMDWADARQAAISAFAAEDAEDAPPSSAKPRPAPLSRASHLAPPNRPASAPFDNRAGPSRTAGPAPGFAPAPMAAARGDDAMEEAPVASSSSLGVSSTTGSVPAAGPTPHRPDNRTIYQPTPAGLMSSPLASPSIRSHPAQPLAPTGKPSKGLPIRYNQTQPAHGESSHATGFFTPPNTLPPSAAAFNPDISHGSSPVPVLSLSGAGYDSIAPAQNYPVGAKRPMVENMMEVEEQTPQQPPQVGLGLTAPGRQGRTSKRRSMGPGKDDAGDGDRSGDRERERDRDRRRGSRRHGPSAGV